MHNSDFYEKIVYTINDTRQKILEFPDRICGQWLKRHSSFTVDYYLAYSEGRERKFKFHGIDNLYSFTVSGNFDPMLLWGVGRLINGYEYLGYLNQQNNMISCYFTKVSE